MNFKTTSEQFLEDLKEFNRKNFQHNIITEKDDIIRYLKQKNLFLESIIKEVRECIIENKSRGQLKIFGAEILEILDKKRKNDD